MMLTAFIQKTKSLKNLFITEDYKKDMIKVSDFIVNYLESIGVSDAFLVTGGGAMHLNDSFGKSEKIKCTYNHHEQACAIAAEGYARQKQKLAVVNVTTGPGGLNTLN